MVGYFIEFKNSSRRKILDFAKILWYYSGERTPGQVEEALYASTKARVSGERKSTIYQGYSLLRGRRLCRRQGDQATARVLPCKTDV